MSTSGNASRGAPVLKLGIIGLGGGASQMIPAFASHPHLAMTAAADVDRDLLETFRRALQGETYLSAAELCLQSDVDAVYIATPNQFHTDQALVALENGKHVLVEKPMTLTLEDADRMIRAAEHHGLQLAVNVKHSFEPRIRQLRDLVLSGELGRLRMLNYWYFNDWLYSPRTAEELNPDLGGGVPWRQGPHQIDILRTIAGGMVRSVRAMTSVWDPQRPVAGSYSSFLEFEDGVVATAVYSGYDHFNSKAFTYQVDRGDGWANRPAYARSRRALRAVGSGEAETAFKKARRFRGEVVASTPPAPWIMGGPLIVSFDQGDVRLSAEGLEIYGDTDIQSRVLPEASDGRDGVIEAFYQAVITGKRPFNHGAWGKATLEVLLALIQSGQERREIFLSHQMPTLD